MKNLTYKAVENSKNTSGESGNNPAGGSGQLTEAQITQLVGIARDMGCTHFLNHFYFDTDAQMQANYSAYSTNYNLRTLEQDIQLWADIVHAAGMKMVYRGTWSAIKGNNNFALATYPSGTNYKPLGTVAGAAAAGETTYCGKLWRFLTTTVGAAHIEDGDIFGPISECTEFLSNSNYTWFDTSAGTQTGLYNFFTTMKDVVDAWGAANGKTLGYMTIVNYSEYRSGYLGQTLPADQGYIPIDYYGHYTTSVNGTAASPEQYVTDWTALRNQVGGGYPIFQTEMGGIFGDSWPTLGATPVVGSPRVNSYEDSAHYQIKFWKAYRDSLVDTGYMNGVSNWGFWSGQNSSIVFYSGGQYKLNYMGQIYANFIKGNGMARIPVLQSDAGYSSDSWGGRSAYF